MLYLYGIYLVRYFDLRFKRVITYELHYYVRAIIEGILQEGGIDNERRVSVMNPFLPKSLYEHLDPPFI